MHNSPMLNICLKKSEDTTDKSINPNPAKEVHVNATNQNTLSMVLGDLIKYYIMILFVLSQANAVADISS